MTKINFRSLWIVTILLLVTSPMFAQIWEIGYSSMTFTDPARGNRVIETNLFYPADVTGWNVPLGSPHDKRYPVIVFGHDEGISFSHYQYTWNNWTRKGFVVAMVLTEMAIPMDVEEYAKDLAFVAAKFKAMRNDNTSFFFNRHNNKSCIIGHGKGGSAALIAPQHYSGLTTMISLAANESVPSAIAAASLVTVPSVVVAGGQDCVSPVGTVQEVIFNNIDSDCKTFINFTASPRCDFAQSAGSCTSTQINCGGPMPYAWQAVCNDLAWYLVSFMRYYMKSNAPALAKFEWKLQQKTQDFLYIMSCNVNSAARMGWQPEDDDEDVMEDFESMKVNIYPNPVIPGNEIKLYVETEFENEATILITNMMGQLVARQKVALDGYYNEVKIPTLNLRKGHYMISVIGTRGRTSKPLIIN